MLRFSFRSAPLPLAALLAAGTAACSGNHSMLPGVSQQTLNGLRESHRGGHVTRLTSQPPDSIQLEWLLTDGTVLAQSNSNWSNFWLYTPDSTGNYANGSWKQVGSLQTGYGPDAAASDVLPNGKFVIIGGEYNTPGNGYDLQLTNLGAVYDPTTQAFTPLGHPKKWGYIGDSESTVLPDGHMILGQKLTEQDAILNAKTMTWKVIGHKGKADFNSEEGWTLLPDGTILTADVKAAPNSEIYNASTHRWTTAGSTIVDLHSPSPYGCLEYGPGLCYYPPGEIGPAMLRPDGTVFATGSYSGGYGAGHTAIYDTKTKTWTKGPDFPNGDNAGDNFAVLEPSGNVLVFGNSGTAYEWNGSTFTQLNGVSEVGAPLLLPTGQILLLGYEAELYTPTGSPNPKWAPTIKKCPKNISAGQTYQISGTQFNGLSLAMSFGDEYQNSTNYPLVRITNNGSGKVYYARTHGHSTMGVQTGKKTVSTSFDVPKGIGSGASKLVVIANGIASKPVNVNVSGH